MPRSLFITLLIIFANLAFAQNDPVEEYQIDLIIFLNQEAGETSMEEMALPVVPFSMQHAVKLDNQTESSSSPYKLLSVNASSLGKAYWAINRKPQYQVLFYGSWRQPKDSVKAVSFPSNLRHAWHVEGTFKIQQRNYYDLNTELLFKSPDTEHPSFVFAKHQRLKSNELYYLDHPLAGMLIKIHPVV